MGVFVSDRKPPVFCCASKSSQGQGAATGRSYQLDFAPAHALRFMAVLCSYPTAGLHKREGQQRVGSVSTRPSGAIAQPAPEGAERCQHLRPELARRPPQPHGNYPSAKYLLQPPSNACEFRNEHLDGFRLRQTVQLQTPVLPTSP